MDLDAVLKAYVQKQPGARRQLGSALYRLLVPIFRGRFAEVDVEDLIQDTIVAVIADLPKFEHRGPGSFRAWVRRIARNRELRLIDRLRREQRQGELSDDLRAARAAGPRLIVHWRERLEVVLDMFTEIDPSFVRALVHLATGGHPDDLAKLEGVTSQTIRSRATRARKELWEEVRMRSDSSGRFLATPS